MHDTSICLLCACLLQFTERYVINRQWAVDHCNLWQLLWSSFCCCNCRDSCCMDFEIGL